MRKKSYVFLIIIILIITLVGTAFLLVKSKFSDNITDENIFEIFKRQGIICETVEFPKWVSENLPVNCEKRLLIIDDNDDCYYGVYILRFDNKQEVKKTIKEFSFNQNEKYFIEIM